MSTLKKTILLLFAGLAVVTILMFVLANSDEVTNGVECVLSTWSGGVGTLVVLFLSLYLFAIQKNNQDCKNKEQK